LREKLSLEEAEVEYAKSERGLRFQLIEGRAMAQSDIKITFEDLKAFTTKNIRQQMAQSDKQILQTKKFKELLQEFCLTKTK
jgi:hypothetical protein